MEFGTQAFFERLKTGVASGDPDFYDDLDKTVERSIGYLVRSKVQYPDSEDVLQIIKITVWQKMSLFLNSSECNLPSQRNAWLKKVAMSKINDFYRKNNMKKDISLEDAPKGGILSCPASEAFSLCEAERLANYRRCCRAISYLCSLDMTPDRLMACLYNGIVLPISDTGAGKKKGDPAAIVQRFSGRPLSELRADLWQELCRLLTFPPPEDLLAPLDQKLRNGGADMPFQLTTREITLVTSRAKSSIKKRREEIVGGTLNE